MFPQAAGAPQVKFISEAIALKLAVYERKIFSPWRGWRAEKRTLFRSIIEELAKIHFEIFSIGDKPYTILNDLEELIKSLTLESFVFVSVLPAVKNATGKSYSS